MPPETADLIPFELLISDLQLKIAEFRQILYTHSKIIFR